MLLMPQINALKGIHPGIFLENELQKRKLKKGRFALTIGEYPQTLTAITRGKRGMNTALALKIEQELSLEEGFLMVLQTFYDIKEAKQKTAPKDHPDLGKFRKALFWDTRMEEIDWNSQREAIVKRVFERGNDQEKQEVVRFYGRELIDLLLEQLKTAG